MKYWKENHMKNVSKLSKIVPHWNSKRNNKFEYNKDAGMYVCKVRIWLLEKLNKE